jgi:hypothetical protein
MRTTGGEKNGLTGGATHSPAIWIYRPDDRREEVDVEVELDFRGNGFMTSSIPNYNGRWRIHIDPKLPYNKYSSTYVDDAWVPYLDYDGFRDGTFQTTHGWFVENDSAKLVEWHRATLNEYGFNETEIDDINVSYVRMLLDRQYKDTYFAIYPQNKTIVDASVSLKVTPKPDSVSRLWLYFVPVKARSALLSPPGIEKVKRKGYAVIELAYLTDREIPKVISDKSPEGERFLSHAGAPLLNGALRNHLK